MTEKLVITLGQQLAFPDEALILRFPVAQDGGVDYRAHGVEVHVFRY
jgi:hypothetical protein